MRNLFITGTDTDVGKTFITAGIVKEFRRIGIEAFPVKPVQTGCVNDVAPDLEFCLKTSGIALDNHEKELLCPVRYEPECSPHLAAKLSGSSINIDDITEKLKKLATENEWIAAEGAGGILVPVGSGRTMLDLMISLNWPVLLVVSNKLGAINHTLLSISALNIAGLDLAGVVINQMNQPSSLYSRDNVKAIREYGDTSILGEVPFSPDRYPTESFRGICEKLQESLQQ